MPRIFPVEQKSDISILRVIIVPGNRSMDTYKIAPFIGIEDVKASSL